MRIIAGEFRSRRLLTPKDDSVTRPIPDRVKESLFGLLRGHCEGASVFDGFAGTGAIGLEAISRGAARCVFVERDRGAADLLRQNIEALGVRDRCDLVIGDALGPGALSRAPRPLTIAFLDPPYPLVRDAVGWRRVQSQLANLIKLLTDDGFAIVRTPWPFFLEAPAAGDAAPERHARSERRGRPNRREHRFDSRSPENRRRESEAQASKEPEPQEATAPPKPDVPLIAADLSLPNASGPETHIYHSTALHLYMRKREITQPGPDAAPARPPPADAPSGTIPA